MIRWFDWSSSHLSRFFELRGTTNVFAYEVVWMLQIISVDSSVMRLFICNCIVKKTQTQSQPQNYYHLPFKNYNKIFVTKSVLMLMTRIVVWVRAKLAIRKSRVAWMINRLYIIVTNRSGFKSSNVYCAGCYQRRYWYYLVVYRLLRTYGTVTVRCVAVKTRGESKERHIDLNFGQRTGHGGGDGESLRWRNRARARLATTTFSFSLYSLLRVSDSARTPALTLSLSPTSRAHSVSTVLHHISYSNIEISFISIIPRPVSTMYYAIFSVNKVDM